MSTKIQLLMLVIPAITLSAWPSAASAASTSVSFGVYPPKITISSPPHQNIQVPIKLVNGGEVQTLKFSTSAIKANEDGSVELTNDQDEAFIWLSIENTQLQKYEIMMSPSEEKTLILNIRVPTNALYSDHYFALLIYTKNDESYSSTYTRSLAQIAVPIILSIKEKGQPESLNVEKFDLPTFIVGNKIPLLLKLKNPDKYFISIGGTITLTPLIAGKKSQSVLSNTEILSNQTRTISEGDLKIITDSIGPTKVTIQIPLYEAPGITLSKTVIIIPIYVVYALLLSVTVLVIFLVKKLIPENKNSRKTK